MTRTFLIALGILATTGAAAAQPGEILPVDGPGPVEITSGDPTVAAHVQARTSAVATCVETRRATFVRTRIKLAWSRAGKVTSVAVSGGGAAFARCVGKALRGKLHAKVARAGSGRVQVVVRTADFEPIPALTPEPEPPPPPPKPPVAGDIHTCRVDGDCRVHFRLSACVPGDPVAVNSLDPARVRTTYPVRRLDCGMGGPQYEELRRSNENRYSTTCVRSRCVLHDAGPRPTDPVRFAP